VFAEGFFNKGMDILGTASQNGIRILPVLLKNLPSLIRPAIFPACEKPGPFQPAAISEASRYRPPEARGRIPENR